MTVEEFARVLDTLRSSLRHKRVVVLDEETGEPKDPCIKYQLIDNTASLSDDDNVSAVVIQKQTT